MLRTIISMYLSLLFVTLLATPTLVTCLDDTIDISRFYACDEKEGIDKDLYISFFEIIDPNPEKSTIILGYHLKHFFKFYAKPHLNLILPPPQSQFS